MSYQIVSVETLRAKRKAEGKWPKHAILRRPIQELITLEDAGAIRQKVELDVAEGRAEVPLLYEPIYQRQTDPNFPKMVDTNFITSAAVIFLEKLEAGEVKFGALAPGVPGVVPIRTWAAGFEYTEDMVEYNQTWSFEELNKSFGEAYNALLNHIHLGAILSYAYTAANQTAATNVHTDFMMEVRETLKSAIQTTTISRRPASVILASIADRFTIEDALNLSEDLNSRSITRLGPDIDYIIYYDGWSITVGKKTYVYPGVTPGKCYLIHPKKYMRELVKHGLRIDFGNPDISRLIEEQAVGRTRRGVYADVGNSVEEVTLPTA